MLRETILFLEEFLRGHGPSAVAKAAVGLMSFAVLLGAVLGSTAIKAGALVTAMLLIVVAGIALLTRRRAERRELEDHRTLVSEYCRLIDDKWPAFQVANWEETAVIGERGDTHSKLKIKLKLIRDDVRFIRLRFDCGWPQPARYRRSVHMTVRNLLIDGSPGTTLRTTVSWPRAGAMAAIAHFHTPLPANSEVSFTVDLIWPRRCAPLLDGAPDEFGLMFREPTRRATYRVLLPEGAEAYVEPVGRTESFKRIQLGRNVDDRGRETIIVRLSDPPIRHRAGVRLQLKEARRASPLR
ncbi:hypothetical protein GCM10011609_38040 [Lentzea pudingi]|uniref:Uncharacterized protein n=1 Tax=Lentzea pudingi TaxID=1789439 RepID=A0ABQ2I2Q2_9PSEU|nr:hypothetical protein [Lentzea pudingi]GGM96669.1 hypothetical protein GCM10011609_38040 [Lentzea pudingi]